MLGRLNERVRCAENLLESKDVPLLGVNCCLNGLDRYEDAGLSGRLNANTLAWFPEEYWVVAAGDWARFMDFWVCIPLIGCVV